MEKGTIHFAQIQYASENQDAFEIATKRLQQICVFFSKNTLMQLLQMEMNMKSYDLLSDIRDQANHSPRFLNELNQYFTDFEEMQNDPALGDLQEKLKVIIKQMNEREII